MSVVLNRAINVLLYEDKDDYANSFKTNAQTRRIIVERVSNTDSLIKLLEESPKKYQFVVLDAKAYNKEGQLPGSESEMNLIRVFRELERLQQQYAVRIPHCINTGQADLKLRIGGSGIVDCKIFDKGEEQLLFDFIISDYLSTDEAKAEFRFPDIFDFACTYFTDADREHLFELYKKEKFASKALADRVVNLSSLRRAAESLMVILHDRYLGGYPALKTSSRLREVSEYLNSEKLIPIHLYCLLTSIRKTASNYGSHPPELSNKISEYPSEHVIIGYALGLNDVFKWANSKLNI